MLSNFFDGIVDMFYGLIQVLINALGDLGDLIDGLPTSPFLNIESMMGENPWIDAVLWVIPVNEMLALLQAWITAIMFYYALKVPLRWAKVVKG